MTTSTAEERATVIAGAGGMGREALQWLADAGHRDPVVGFVGGPDTPAGTTSAGLPVFADLATPRARYEQLRVLLAVGASAIRRRVAAEAASLDVPLVGVVHPLAYVGPDVQIAEGAIVGPFAMLPRDIHVGPGSIVNYTSVVGHDVHLGAFVFVGPTSVVGGGSHIADGAYLGMGARILPELRVGSDAVVGAGAVVTRDVAPGATVVGNPARPVG